MSDRVKELVDAGVILSRAGDREGALKLCQEALRLEPGHPRAQELLAELSAAGRARAEPTPFAPPPEDLFAHVAARASSNPFAPPPGAHKAVNVLAGSPFGADGLSTEPAPPLVRGASLDAFPPSAPMPRLPAAVSPRPPLEEWAARSAGDVGQDLSIEVQLGEVQPSPARGQAEDDPFQIIEPSSPPLPRPGTLESGEVEAWLRGAKDMLQFADHTGAMELVDKVLAVAPKHQEAQRLRTQCEETLLSMYESKLGDLNRRPTLLLRPDEVIWLNLDHRAGFILAQIDGGVSLEDVFALSGMSRLDTARILAQLVEEKVIGI